MGDQTYRMERKLDTVIDLLHILIAGEQHMAGELDALKAQVAANTSVEGGAVLLLQGIAAQIAALVASGGSPADFTALSTQLKGSADALAAAVAANVPPVPAPPVAAPKKP